MSINTQGIASTLPGAMNTNAIMADLIKMTPQQRQEFAQIHSQDPLMLATAKYVDNKIKDQATAYLAAQQHTAPPKVNEQVVASMAPPQAPQQQMQSMQAQGLPEDSGIAQLSAPNMKRLAGGGIVAFAEGGDYGNEGRNAKPSFEQALAMEGIDDPRQRAFLKAIYSQETGSGKNTKTSNKGAVGHMQILPDTFDSVADEDMDIKNPLDNMRAGIRYASQGYSKAGGDPVLAGAYYYGGPNGMKKAAKGVETADSANPKAPTTISYGKSVAKKMFDLLPMGSAQAESLPPAAGITALAAKQKQAAAPVAGPATEYTTPSALESEAMTPGQFESRVQAVPTLQQQQDAQRAAIASQVPEGYTRPAMKNDPRYGLAGLTPPSFNAPSAAGGGRGTVNPPMVNPDEERAPIEETAAAAPVKNPDDWTREDWMAFTAGMANNESPYFTKMLGGGLGGVAANRNASKKYALEKSLNEAHVAELQGRAGLYPSREELNQARKNQLQNVPTGQDKMAFTALQTTLRDLSNELATLERTDPNSINPTTGARKAALSAQIAAARGQLNQYTQAGQSGTISAAPAITVPSAVTVTKVG